MIEADATALKARLARQHTEFEARLSSQNSALRAQVEALLVRIASLESSVTLHQSEHAP